MNMLLPLQIEGRGKNANQKANMFSVQNSANG